MPRSHPFDCPSFPLLLLHVSQNLMSASPAANESSCELCKRICPKLTVHHLTPRQQTKRKNKRRRQDLGPTIDICPPCHKQVHALFTNQELATDLHSADLLRSHPAMQKFLTWIIKQDPYKKIRVHR